MDGIVNVLKPPGMSSHDVVAYIRHTLKEKKVGHTGTLDPNAAGVLPICIGKATKITQYLIEKRKKYRCELILGRATDTQDKYGKIVNCSNLKVNTSDIIEAFNSFKGSIEQIPPIFSAIRHNGKRLYEIAREGKDVERKPRKVKIYDLSIISIWDNKRILFEVECSKGTYIRTLCDDIGKKLGTYGYMSFLLRTEVSNFKLENSYTLEEINQFVENGEIGKLIIPLDYPLQDLKQIVMNNSKYKNVIMNGGTIPLTTFIKNSNIKENEKIRVYFKDMFIGIGNIKMSKNETYLKMEKVLV